MRSFGGSDTAREQVRAVLGRELRGEFRDPPHDDHAEVLGAGRIGVVVDRVQRDEQVTDGGGRQERGECRAGRDLVATGETGDGLGEEGRHTPCVAVPRRRREHPQACGG
jgi:hypothetical protein